MISGNVLNEAWIAGALKSTETYNNENQHVLGLCSPGSFHLLFRLNLCGTIIPILQARKVRGGLLVFHANSVCLQSCCSFCNTIALSRHEKMLPARSDCSGNVIPSPTPVLRHRNPFKQYIQQNIQFQMRQTICGNWKKQGKCQGSVLGKGGVFLGLRVLPRGGCR